MVHGSCNGMYRSMARVTVHGSARGVWTWGCAERRHIGGECDAGLDHWHARRQDKFEAEQAVAKVGLKRRREGREGIRGREMGWRAADDQVDVGAR